MMEKVKRFCNMAWRAAAVSCLVLGLAGVMLPKAAADAGIMPAVALPLPGSMVSYGAETEQRVFDYGDLLSSQAERELEAEIAALQEKMGMDAVLVTIVDAEGKSAQDYADDFYDEGGFGTRKDYSGALYLIDMDNREIYISTSGTMIRFLTDERIEDMLDHAFSYVAEGDYEGTAWSFLEDTAYWYQKGIPGGQYNYDIETGQISRYLSIRWYEALIAFAVAAVCGAGACASVKKEYSMEKEQRQASNFLMAYRVHSNFILHDQKENLINSFVTHARIPKNNGGGRSGGSSSGRSSTHRSSSGRRHGGGGRSF